MVRLFDPKARLAPNSLPAILSGDCTEEVLWGPRATRETAFTLTFASRAASASRLESPAMAAWWRPSNLLTAPPCERRARPSEHKASRSARAVTAETEKRDV